MTKQSFLKNIAVTVLVVLVSVPLAVNSLKILAHLAVFVPK
jgi:hypothetical protein